MREREIFTVALEKTDSGERSAFLEEACGNDVALRERIETLLRAHQRAEDHSSSTPSAPEERLRAEAPKDLDRFTPSGAETAMAVGGLEALSGLIWPYKLLEEIGEGGMGIVYLAEQQEPIRRLVAVKIIRPGMDSRHVVARFEAERQALALMDHENIARVLDAGTTQDGQPYFVMELVRGLPITEYCDKHRLEPRERLELFLPVCHAVQHAHQKGIIHRDLKPSNIIISMTDGRAVAKVIDFGIAKAMGQRLTDLTLFTQHGQIVGTVQYMSPEQAESGGLDVDTRSDIYSLGVVLYELFTGTTPLSRDRLKDANLTDLLRAVRDEEPPNPSTRVRSATDTIEEIAALRKTEPAKLGRTLQGDLDWIVMRCLEKDRTRRYETANGLAMDIQRFLKDEPVLAGPPSAAYKLYKFVRRHRIQVIAAGAVIASLSLGTIGTVIQLFHAKSAESLALRRLDEVSAQKQRAQEAEQKAVGAQSLALSRLAELTEQKQRAEEAEKKANAEAAKSKAVSDFLTKDLLAQANPDVNQRADQVTVEQLLDRASDRVSDNDVFADQPEVEAEVRATLAEAYRSLGLNAKAEEHWRRVLHLSLEVYGEEDAEHTLAAMNELARALAGQDRLREAEDLLKLALPLHRHISGSEATGTLFVINNLAIAVAKQGRLKEAEPLFLENWTTRNSVFGKDDPDTLLAQANYGALLKHQGRYKEAEPLLREAVDSYKAIGYEEKEAGLGAANGLGTVLIHLGKYEEAAEILRDCAERQERVQGANHPDTLGTLTNYGFVLCRLERVDEALDCLRRSYEGHREVSGFDHEQTLAAMNSLALALRDAKRWGESETLIRELIAIIADKPGGNQSSSLIYLNNLGWILEGQGKFEEAEATYRDVLERAPLAFSLNHPTVLISRHCLTRVLLRLNRFAESETEGRETWAIRQSVLGSDHRDTLATAQHLALAIQKQDRLEEAESLEREILTGRRNIRGGEGEVANTLVSLASNLVSQRKFAEAIPLLEECIAIREKKFPGRWQVHEARSVLGETLGGLQQFEDAELLLLASQQELEQQLGDIAPENRYVLSESRQRLARFYEAWGKPDRAAAWRTDTSVSQKK